MANEGRMAAAATAAGVASITVAQLKARLHQAASRARGIAKKVAQDSKLRSASEAAMASHLQMAVTEYARAMAAGSPRHSWGIVFRLVALWFEHSENDKVSRVEGGEVVPQRTPLH